MVLLETDRPSVPDSVPNQYQEVWHNVSALEQKGWLGYGTSRKAQNLLEIAQHNPFAEELLPIFGRISAETEKGRVAQIVDFVAQLWPDLAIRKLVVPFSHSRLSFERELKKTILQTLEPNSPALSSLDSDVIDKKLHPILDSLPKRNITIGFATAIPGRQGITPYWFGKNGGINSWESLQKALYGYPEVDPQIKARKPWLEIGLLGSMPPKSEIIINLHKPKDYGSDSSQHFVVRVRRFSDGHLQIEFGPETADFRDLEFGSPKFFISGITATPFTYFPRVIPPSYFQEKIEENGLATIIDGDWLPITSRINIIAQMLAEFCQRTNGFITSESIILTKRKPIHPFITNTELVNQIFDMEMADNHLVGEDQSQPLSVGQTIQETKTILLGLVEKHIAEPLVLWLKENPEAVDAAAKLVFQIHRNRRHCEGIMREISASHPEFLQGIPNSQVISEIYHMSISLSDLSLDDLESGNIEKTRAAVQNILNLFFYFDQRLHAPDAMISSHRQMAEACLKNVAFQWKEFKRNFLGHLYQGEKGYFLKNLFDCLEVFGFDTLEFIGCPSYWPWRLFLYEVR